MIKGDVTVAVIDDDPSVRRGLSRLFRSREYRVETYASARGFLERGDFARFACLVLDVRMPGQTGLDLQEVLTVGGHTLPIVFITGHGDVPLEVRALGAGAVDVLAKPFDDETLFRAVERAVQKNRTVRTAGERR